MGEDEVIRSPDTERQDRIPPGQRATDRWPVLHYGPIPDTDIAKWTFTISGLVSEERKISYQEFMSLPRVKVLSDIHCVTGWSRLDNLCEGPGTGVVGELATILPEAKFVVVHSAGGFRTNLTLSDFFQADVLFAVKHKIEPLKPPARLSGEACGSPALFLEKRQMGCWR